MFIFPASLAEDTLAQAVEKVKAEIVKAGGSIADSTILGRRDFSRPMRRDAAGSYVRMRFDMAPGAMPQLLSRLKLNEHLLRQQIVIAEAAIAAPEAPDAKPE
jgi:ribosomal protein S6